MSGLFRVVLAGTLVAACSGSSANATTGSDGRDDGGPTGPASNSAATRGNDASSEGGAADPLLGTWYFMGKVPAEVTMAFTFNADKTFSIVEQVAPPTEPAGHVSDGCTTTDTYLGTYA